jgi:ribosome-associated protein
LCATLSIPADHVPLTSSYIPLASVAARAADAKKATDVVILDVGDLLGITDLFVIASASNRRLALTLADEMELAVKRAGGPSPLSVEGLEEATWILIDFGPFVVHVFQQETREFYDLERLWRDAPRVAWVPDTPANAADSDEDSEADFEDDAS